MNEDFPSFSLWDHIEDLRLTLIKILIVIVMGFSVALFFYSSIFQIIIPKSSSQPIFKEKIIQERWTNSSSKAVVISLPEGAELHKGIKSESYLLGPGEKIEYSLPLNKLMILTPMEGLLITFKICFWISLALTCPVWSYLLLRFILPGLKSQEKRLILPLLFGSYLSLILGTLAAYFFTIPLANEYFESFNEQIGVNFWSLSSYLDYILILFFSHIVAFELAFVFFILIHYRILSIEWLSSKRRYLITLAFILGALLTPPDILTQLLLAIPLVAIFELALLYGKIRLYFAKG